MAPENLGIGKFENFLFQEIPGIFFRKNPGKSRNFFKTHKSMEIKNDQLERNLQGFPLGFI